MCERERKREERKNSRKNIKNMRKKEKEKKKNNILSRSLCCAIKHQRFRTTWFWCFPMASLDEFARIMYEVESGGGAFRPLYSCRGRLRTFFHPPTETSDTCKDEPITAKMRAIPKAEQIDGGTSALLRKGCPSDGSGRLPVKLSSSNQKNCVKSYSHSHQNRLISETDFNHVGSFSRG